jgi:hypothetical protein
MCTDDSAVPESADLAAVRQRYKMLSSHADAEDGCARFGPSKEVTP